MGRTYQMHEGGETWEHSYSLNIWKEVSLGVYANLGAEYNIKMDVEGAGVIWLRTEYGGRLLRLG